MRRVILARNPTHPTSVNGRQNGKPVCSEGTAAVANDHRMLIPVQDSDIAQEVCADTTETSAPSACRTDRSGRLYARVQS